MNLSDATTETEPVSVCLGTDNKYLIVMKRKMQPDVLALKCLSDNS